MQREIFNLAFLKKIEYKLCASVQVAKESLKSDSFKTYRALWSRRQKQDDEGAVIV